MRCRSIEKNEELNRFSLLYSCPILKLSTEFRLHFYTRLIDLYLFEDVESCLFHASFSTVLVRLVRKACVLCEKDSR